MSNRKDTCKGKPCPFWVRYGDNCPNYTEGEWTTMEGHRYTTKDCAPKRAMILAQQVYDHMLDVRRDYGTVRNANERVIQMLQDPLGVMDAELIEDKTDGKDTD